MDNPLLMHVIDCCRYRYCRMEPDYYGFTANIVKGVPPGIRIYDAMNSIKFCIGIGAAYAREFYIFLKHCCCQRGVGSLNRGTDYYRACTWFNGAALHGKEGVPGNLLDAAYYALLFRSQVLHGFGAALLVAVFYAVHGGAGAAGYYYACYL